METKTEVKASKIISVLRIQLVALSLRGKKKTKINYYRLNIQTKLSVLHTKTKSDFNPHQTRASSRNAEANPIYLM